MAIDLGEEINPVPSQMSRRSVDTSEQPMPPSHKPKFQSGWRFSLFTGAASCIVVFVVNLFATIWALTRDEKNRLGQPVLKEGTCSDMRYLNIGLHVIINALSSVLLATSNYGMQCLSAPTRADIDKAHLEGKWLDIGIPSVHNLRRLPVQRVVLWALLMLSSLPLHLVYNSVVFASLAPIDYDIWTIQSTGHGLSQSELFERPWNVSNEWTYDFYPERHFTETWAELKRLGASNKLKRLTNLECIHHFGTSFQTSYQSVILVTEKKPVPNSIDRVILKHEVYLFPVGLGSVYHWVCGSHGECDVEIPDWSTEICRSYLPTLKKAAADWAPFCDKVEYCYTRPIEEKCQLTFSPAFIAYVLISNALKAAILLYIALRPPEKALFVLGDAVESFLTVPDAFSSDSCLASVDDIRKKPKRDWTGPRTWTPVRRRWAAAISRRRWAFSISFYLVSLSTLIFFFVFGLGFLVGPREFRLVWGLGFGAITELTLIRTRYRDIADSFNMTESVLLANLPQFVFSGLYFQYNALFTGMLTAREWSDFSRKRKGLRVSSDPRGEQRSRYFLQLPYRWSIPLILMSMLIHSMLSQSIFLVAIEFETAYATTCGYSPVAIMAAIIAILVMGMAVIISSCLRLPTAMPVVGNYSLGIAAACHGLGGTDRPDEPLVPLQWGAVAHPVEGSEVEEPGHCGFSGDFVDEPRVGAKYA